MRIFEKNIEKIEYNLTYKKMDLRCHISEFVDFSDIYDEEGLCNNLIFKICKLMLRVYNISKYAILQRLIKIVEDNN